MPCPRCGGEHPAGTCVSIGDLRTGLARPGRPEAVLDLAPGTLVGGRYRIDAFIGQGGMGVVYRAHDSRPSRSVALKFLAVRDRADESAFARFEKEAELIASLNHLNIIQVIEIGESDGNKYIAMELADGGTLRDLVKKRGKLPVEEASALMKQVGQALSHAHRKGVVHRDLKPANVLLTKEGVPKLCDFGLAKGLTDSEMSRTGYGMGTLGFMSPEQRRDAKGVDHRTDIYSWGATFYQLATGKDPLAWDPEIIPASVAPLIRKCMKEMEERYFSMEEALGAMEQAPSGGHAAVVVEEGTCPQCRKANRLDVRFCEGCGAGLFEKCPKCGAEGRAPIRFCGKCGCDAAKERKYRDHWAQAQKLAEACQFSRAIKEVDAALALCPEETEARQLGDEVRRKMSALDTLRLRLEECWKAKEYEGAEGAARKILEIDPNDDKAKKVVIEAPVLRRKKDAAKALAEARDSLARRDLDAALEAADRACKLDPANANAQAVQADLTERKAKLDETVADAEEHLKARRYEDAVAIADRVLAEWPNSAAEKVKREAQAALDQLRKHLAQGQKALEAGRHEEAATHFEAAVALRPDREVQKKAGTARAIVKRKFVRAAAVAAVVAIAAVVVLATWAAIDNRVKLSRGERVMAEGKFAEAQESFLAVGWVLADRERARGLVSACDRAREAERFERAGQWAEEMRAWEDVLAAAPATRPFRDACARKVEQAYAEAMKRAHDHFDGKRWALALTACDEALRVKPGDAGAEEKKRKIRQAEVDWRYQEAMTRAEKHLAAKEWVQAAEACDEALRVKPGDAGAEEKKRKIRQAEVEWRYEEAMGRAERHLAAKEWVQAAEACDEALRVKPGDAGAKDKKRKIRQAEVEWRYEEAMSRAAKHLAAKEWVEAGEACEEALGLKPENTAATELKRKIREAEREWRYRDAIGRAERHLKAREWKQAREACDEALVAKPGDAPARELKANATSKAYDEAMREAAGAEGTDDLGTAEAAYRCALALKPGDENASAGLKRLKEPLVICLDESRRVKMEFVHIKAGKFTMGSNQFDDEKPPHTVTISRDFWMQRTEVTQAQWMAIMGTNPSNRKGDDLPVECVSWDDCKSFLAKLKEKCGSQLNGRVARLPTEAEWEYACRAGSTGQWCFGDDSSDLREYAWGEGISGDKTQPVGQKKGNAWGVYDMHGNVSEWCEDSYGSYSSRAATDPTGGSGTGRRIVRGGSWSYYGHVEWRSAGRHREYPSYIHYLLGMRAVLRAK